MSTAGPIQNVRWTGDDRRVAVVEAAGEIDLHRSAEFQQGLMEVVSGKPRMVVVDLTNVGYVDSSGVASLVKLLSRVRRENVPLKLAGLNARVRSVFEITRLDTVFDIYDNVEEALAT